MFLCRSQSMWNYWKIFSSVRVEVESIESIKPRKGLVQVLPLYLTEFKRLNTIMGDGFDISLFSDDIVVV